MDPQLIQQALLGLLAVIYGGLLYEIRALRKAKHAQAQYIQYALLCLSVLARELNVDLPKMEKDE